MKYWKYILQCRHSIQKKLYSFLVLFSVLMFSESVAHGQSVIDSTEYKSLENKVTLLQNQLDTSSKNRRSEMHDNVVKQKALIEAEKKLELAKIDLKSAETKFKEEKQRLKEHEKSLKKEAEKIRKEKQKLIRQNRRDSLLKLRQSPEFKIDSIESYINQRILRNETPNRAKVKISDYCSIAFLTDKDNFYFNMESINDITENNSLPYVKSGSIFSKNVRSNFYTISLRCDDNNETLESDSSKGVKGRMLQKKQKNNCIRVKDKKYVNKVDATIPLGSERSAIDLINHLNAASKYCKLIGSN